MPQENNNGNNIVKNSFWLMSNVIWQLWIMGTSPFGCIDADEVMPDVFSYSKMDILAADAKPSRSCRRWTLQFTSKIWVSNKILNCCTSQWLTGALSVTVTVEIF